MVGAGACGLTAVKALTDARLSVQCFEKSDRVGGNWVFKNKNGQSSAYRSLHINTSRERMQFRDFPMPKSYPDYPKHDLIARYFQDYAEAFELERQIRFQTGVERARAARRRWLSTHPVERCGRGLRRAGSSQWTSLGPRLARASDRR